MAEEKSMMKKVMLPVDVHSICLKLMIPHAYRKLPIILRTHQSAVTGSLDKKNRRRENNKISVGRETANSP